MEEAIRRRRRLRHLQERRRRAAIRRRNALMVAALISAVIGAIVGSGAGGESEHAVKPVKLARGGIGPPPETADLESHQGPVPILMYHVIARPPPAAQLPQLFVEPKTFAAQTESLARRGYTAVTLNQVYDAWFREGKLPPKPIVLTFDDGYRGDYVFARRALRRLRWPGDLNLLVGNLGEELSNRMVEQLIDDGWELDAHTITHLDLTTMKGSRLRREVAGSREVLRRRFHQPVNFFCYPAGKYNVTTIRAVRRAGYLGATTELPGNATRSRMFQLHRIRVEGSDGVSGLIEKLERAGA